jgi:phage terminase large subunit-like protein
MALPLRALAKIANATRDNAKYDWDRLARPKQKPPPGDWRFWLLLAGRGGGKTRTAAEWVRKQARDNPGCQIMIGGSTAADVRDVMVEGTSGLLSIHPDHEKPRYEPSKRRLTWPNGTVAQCCSADEPDQFRGHQQHFAWADEIAKWRYSESWDQLLFGLRLGTQPRAVVSTTPRPTKLIRELVDDKLTITTRWSTFDNAANLAPAFISQITDKWEGTRLGRQELYAEILDDAAGALWKRELIDATRVKELPEITRLVVAIDPAVTAKATSDETGLVVVALGRNGHGYVIADHSGRYSPDEWARQAVGLYRHHKANLIVAETNQGGEMVGHTIRTIDPDVAFSSVHASKGKRARAEPVAALYEQARVHHVGMFPELEDQLCTWDAMLDPASPDRLDALVWGISELMVDGYSPDVQTPSPRIISPDHVGMGFDSDFSGYDGDPATAAELAKWAGR